MRSVLSCVLIASAALPAYADDPAGEQAADEANEVDYSIPSGPAFTFLGASPSEIAQPGSYKDLGVELANSVDSEGRLQGGIAIAARPTALTGIDWMRGLELSAGTVHVETEMADVVPIDAAVGFRWTIIDEGDPWRISAFRQEVEQEFLDCAPCAPTPLPGEPGYDAALVEKQRSVRRRCLAGIAAAKRKEFEDEHWNAFRVEVGGATGWRLPDGKPAASESFILGHAWWGLASGKIPGALAEHSMWTAVAQFEQRHDVEGGPYVAELKTGARVFLGNNRLHGYAELVFEGRRVPEGMTDVDNTDLDWSIGAEVRVNEKHWLTIGLGNALDEDDDVQVIGSLKWAISDSARFDRPSQ